MAYSFLQSPANPHFFQPLLPGFHSHLNIPVKFFSLYIEGRDQGDTMDLKSNACNKTWKVKMNCRKLTIGWNEFVIANDFRIGDIIVFRHERDLVFHVTALGLSCCEIMYVQDQNNISKLSSVVYTGKCPIKKQVKEMIPKAKPESCSLDQFRFVAHVTDSNLREDTLYLPKKFANNPNCLKKENKEIILTNGVKTWTLILKFRDSSKMFYMKGGWRSFCHENGFQVGDSIKFKLESNNTQTPLLCFSSTSETKSVETKHSNKWKRKSGDMLTDTYETHHPPIIYHYKRKRPNKLNQNLEAHK